MWMKDENTILHGNITEKSPNFIPMVFGIVRLTKRFPIAADNFFLSKSKCYFPFWNEGNMRITHFILQLL